MKAPTSYKYYFNGRAYFPAIPMYVWIGKKRIRLLTLIDSGANISIFNNEAAVSVGIQIEDGEQVSLSGVGGRIVGYIHQLHLEVADKKFLCPVVFSREYHVSFNLLGREAFFTQFTITFEEKHQRLKLS